METIIFMSLAPGYQHGLCLWRASSTQNNAVPKLMIPAAAGLADELAPEVPPAAGISTGGPRLTGLPKVGGGNGLGGVPIMGGSGVPITAWQRGMR